MSSVDAANTIRIQQRQNSSAQDMVIAGAPQGMFAPSILFPGGDNPLFPFFPGGGENDTQHTVMNPEFLKFLHKRENYEKYDTNGDGLSPEEMQKAIADWNLEQAKKGTYGENYIRYRQEDFDKLRNKITDEDDDNVSRRDLNQAIKDSDKPTFDWRFLLAQAGQNNAPCQALDCAM